MVSICPRKGERERAEIVFASHIHSSKAVVVNMCSCCLLLLLYLYCCCCIGLICTRGLAHQHQHQCHLVRRKLVMAGGRKGEGKVLAQKHRNTHTHYYDGVI